jgi:hypothetical protein
MPDYQAAAYPVSAPGMPCGVDAAVNGMLPHAVASNRGTNLFHALKNESTGTRTFTLFAPAGAVPNLTAFHYETKKRRSYNIGSGDLIIQPLATLDNVRALMRVHAAVAGRHTRHGQLLPLECYLEEGVALVLHLRNGPRATLCELPEQSMHAFVSFSHLGSTPTALKASCNDFDLVWEVDSAYWLEKLATAYEDLQTVLTEEALPSDGADTWVQSSYLTKHPATLAEVHPAYKPPWMCELKGAAISDGPEAEDGDLDWGMDVIAVRLAEKLLDTLSGRLAADTVAGWAGELPTLNQCRAALERLRPVLSDMRSRAVSERPGSANSDVDAVVHAPELRQCQFSVEYLEALQGTLEAALSEGNAGGGGEANGGGLQVPAAAGVGPNGCTLQRQPSWGPLLEAKLNAGLLHGTASKQRRSAMRTMSVELEQDGKESLAAASPAVLRAAWLLRLEMEWQAAVARPCDLGQLALRRQRRAAVEAAWDVKCGQVIAENANVWGLD